MNDSMFAARIRERYSEGLTGLFAVGGTRTTYALETGRQAADPGRITDFSAHSEYLAERYRQLVRTFFDLGGQNAIVTAFSFHNFYNRGEEFATLAIAEFVKLITDNFDTFYHENGADPYFLGTDALHLLASDSVGHQLADKLVDYQQRWTYQPGRRKFVWEIASIPLYTLWNVFKSLTDAECADLEAQIAALPNLEDVNRLLYGRFSRVAFGTEIPMPHFYLGTNRSGDLKLRSPLSLTLTSGDYMRMYYTPYPSLNITHETMQAILDDLAFGERFHSTKTDYSGQYTPELVQAEYERVLKLSADPTTTLGLSRRVKP